MPVASRTATLGLVPQPLAYLTNLLSDVVGNVYQVTSGSPSSWIRSRNSGRDSPSSASVVQSNCDMPENTTACCLLFVTPNISSNAGGKCTSPPHHLRLDCSYSSSCYRGQAHGPLSQ